MKKNILILFVMAVSGAFAVPSYMNFSTKGVDKYADGKTVVDGECYALVRVPTGKKFAGFAANGREADATTGKIWVTAPIAKGGRCPYVLFNIPDGLDVGGGTWAVYLLDTRLFVNGSFSAKLAGIGADGYAKQVNSYGLVENAAIAENSVTTGSAVTASGKSVLPTDIPQSEITSMKIEGDNIRLTVKNTVPYLQYNAAAGEDVSGTDLPAAKVPQAGADTTDEEIELIIPKPDGESAFFKIIRN